jgi:hypothetical protein
MEDEKVLVKRGVGDRKRKDKLVWKQTRKLADKNLRRKVE